LAGQSAHCPAPVVNRKVDLAPCLDSGVPPVFDHGPTYHARVQNAGIGVADCPDGYQILEKLVAEACKAL
jgi:hypothetical protein